MTDPQTDMGGSGRVFPNTRWTILKNAQDPESPTYRRSIEEFAEIYWRPVYAYFRRKWSRSNEEAKDLTQSFFLALCERNFLSRMTPDQGRFRHYVTAALDNFARLQHRHDTALKRGGGAIHFSLEIEDGCDVSSTDSPEQVFQREWAGTVLDHALDQMEREYQERDKRSEFALFLRREVERPDGEDLSYETLARQFKVQVGDVKNILYRARQRLKEIVLQIVRDSVTTPAEADAEMKELFEGLTS